MSCLQCMALDLQEIQREFFNQYQLDQLQQQIDQQQQRIEQLEHHQPQPTTTITTTTNSNYAESSDIVFKVRMCGNSLLLKPVTYRHSTHITH